MTTALGRYVSRQVVLALAAITVVLTVAIWLAYSLRLVDFLVNRGLPLGTFFFFIALMLPRFLAIALPIATFVAVLFVFHRLATDSELVVMRASGMSDWRLARPALLVATLISVLVGLLNFQIAPSAARAFKDLETGIRNDYLTMLTQAGVFQTLSNGLTIYVREQYGEGEFRGILIHDARDAARRVTWMAERGAIVNTAEGPRAVLANGNRQEIDRQTGRLSLLYFDKNTVDLGKLGRSVGDRLRDTRERSLGELLNADAASVGENNVGKYRAEGHQRIADLLTAPGLAALALAAMLYGQFSRRGYTWRVGQAVLLGLVATALSLTTKGAAGRFPDAWPVIYLVSALPLAVGLAILLRPAKLRTLGARAPDNAALAG